MEDRTHDRFIGCPILRRVSDVFGYCTRQVLLNSAPRGTEIAKLDCMLPNRSWFQWFTALLILAGLAGYFTAQFSASTNEETSLQNSAAANDAADAADLGVEKDVK